MASNLSSVCGGVGDRESLRSVLIEHHTIYLLFTTQTTFTVLAAPANRFDEIGSFFPVYCDKKKKKKIDFRVVVIRQRCHSTFNDTYKNVARKREKKGEQNFSFLYI
jgi:hypothetical protein